MNEVGVPYKKRSAKTRKLRVPPPPDIPAPNPEVPPPSEPVPGEPIRGSQKQVFVCPICGKVFNNKEELQLHMANNHPGSTSPNK